VVLTTKAEMIGRTEPQSEWGTLHTSYLNHLSPHILHRLCMHFASPLYAFCIAFVRILHRLCTHFASLSYSFCIAFVRILHRYRTRFASLLYSLCIHFVSLFSPHPTRSLLMPTKNRKSSKPQSPRTLDEALQKLVEAPRFIQHHGGLTPTEESRIKDGLGILQESTRPSPTMVGNYWQFLKSVENDSGSEMVGLCAAAFGRTAIGRMKHRLRVELALKVKENQANLHCEAVNKAVQDIKQSEHTACPLFLIIC
jgi:hypothetical protein